MYDYEEDVHHQKLKLIPTAWIRFPLPLKVKVKRGLILIDLGKESYHLLDRLQLIPTPTPLISTQTCLMFKNRIGLSEENLTDEGIIRDGIFIAEVLVFISHIIQSHHGFIPSICLERLCFI